jgi:hypothetical protein
MNYENMWKEVKAHAIDNKDIKLQKLLKSIEIIHEDEDRHLCIKSYGAFVKGNKYSCIDQDEHYVYMQDLEGKDHEFPYNSHSKDSENYFDSIFAEIKPTKDR